MYHLGYNHLSSLTCAKHGFKPTYNVADKFGLCIYNFGGCFSSKVTENKFLLFYGICGPKVLNFLVTSKRVQLINAS